jgi:putative endonuclease
MYTVYILQSLKDKRTYVGYTNDFERRFQEHNSGQSKATSYRTPFKLLFKEEFENITEAKKRELWWKSGMERKKLKEHFNKKI